MQRADRVGLLPAQAVELGRLELALGVVGLVGRDDDRRLRRAQDLGGLLVGGRHARVGVDHEDDHVRLVDRQARLLLDPLLDRIAGRALEPARVDDDEAAAVPLGDVVEAVARRARAVLDDRPGARRRRG